MENLAVSSTNRVSVFQHKRPVPTKTIILNKFEEHKIKIVGLSRSLLLISFGGEICWDEFSQWQNQECRYFERCSSLAKDKKLIEFSCKDCPLF